MSKLPKDPTRRWFFRLALVGLTTTLAGMACRFPASPVSTTRTPSAVKSADPSPTTRAVPTAVAATQHVTGAPEVFPSLRKELPDTLRNRNDPHYNVRYVNHFSPVDHDAWRLNVTGLVKSPGTYSLTELLTWRGIDQVSRMKCVECWSYKAKWGGFHYQSLAERVEPLPEATHVRFDCADDYWEIVSLDELADPRVLFVLKMNDDLLLDEYGAPLRLMFPAKYGYKSAKAVTAVTFADQGGRGFWSSAGSYSSDGQILAGIDQPQETPGEWREITGGEITSY